MRKGTLAVWTLGLLAAAGGVYLWQPGLFGDEAAALYARFTGGEKLDSSAWADPEGLCNILSDKIDKELRGGLSPANVKRFLSKPENRLLLAQWTAAHAEADAAEQAKKDEDIRAKRIAALKDSIAETEKLRPQGERLGDKAELRLKRQKEELAALEREAMLPHSMLELVNTPEGRKLMDALGNDEEWMQKFAYTPECIRPGLAAAMLAQIIKKDPEALTDPMKRDIATATALEFARANASVKNKAAWPQEDAVKRAEFFMKNWRAGQLNIMFRDLPFWQRRIVCGCKGDNDFGSPESLEWALDNVNLPADQYGGCEWRCGYKSFNIYAQSVQGPNYYTPFTDIHGKNRMRATFDVGGVCGGLSHFGAFAALAHGVPALTAGEPGHCAFIVLMGDKWTPSYSLSWQRGLHWQVWPNLYVYSSLHAATDMFSKEQEKATRLGQAYRTLGNRYAAQKDMKRAVECYGQASKAQPRDIGMWRDWSALLSAAPEGKDQPQAGKAADWRKLHDAVCKRLAPLYPELAAEVLKDSVYPGLAKAMADDPSMLNAAVLSFWKNVKEMGPDRWRIEELADAQLKALGIKTDNADALCGAFRSILGSVADNAAYAPVIISWGNALSAKLPAKDQGKFMAALVDGLGAGSGMDAADRDKLLGPALLAAEKARDLTTFQAIGKMLSPEALKPVNPMPGKLPVFPGKLVSQGGMIWTSSTSRFDKPCKHWSFLEPAGGHFHTDKDKDAYVAVQLPRQANVTGLVIVATPGNQWRLGNMKIQVSQTGKDDDWTDVAQLGPCKQRVHAVDLGNTLPLAKYVRILRPGGPEFFHLNAVFVYGNPAA